MKGQKCIVYCENATQGMQSYFLRVEKRDYYLFSQQFRKSNKEFFEKGVALNAALDYSLSESTSVRKTMSKLIPHIRYVEKTYDLLILRKTRKAKIQDFRAGRYNRRQYKNAIDMESA